MLGSKRNTDPIAKTGVKAGVFRTCVCRHDANRERDKSQKISSITSTGLTGRTRKRTKP
jgi:hypothetical protein